MKRRGSKLLCYISMGSAMALIAVRASADEGRIPVSGPTTISTPGHYIVTRDIAVSSGTVITINTTHVTLDLNGHTISSTSTAGNLIDIQSTADLLTIRNGRLYGGANGIGANSTVGLTISMDHLEIDGCAERGIYLNGAADVDLLQSNLINNPGGIHVAGVGSNPVTGRFVGNTIGGGVYCLTVMTPRDVQVVDNVVTYCGQQGMQLGGGGVANLGGNLVKDNVVAGSGIGINLYSGTGNQVLGNVLRLNGIGIDVQTGSNRIAGNTIQGSTSTAPCGGGVCVTGPRNFLEGNLIEDSSPGCGIRFFGSLATSNAYRNNMLRNNAAGATCLSGGASATDAGGNIF